MKHNIKVSVLVPFYNVENYVGRCLDSLFTQTYKNIEYVFVDSDDYIDDDMVELLVEAAVKEDADISGCGYIEEYEDHSVEHPQKYTNDHNEMMKAITLLTIKGVMWKLLVRSTIVTKHKDEVRFIPDRNMVDDYLFCCQLFYYA